ncbi:MAG TPA: TolC family protein, partial [Gemmataceae bacterium]|nr:TolC family protein [Gemmataceae bacterium]
NEPVPVPGPPDLPSEPAAQTRGEPVGGVSVAPTSDTAGASTPATGAAGRDRFAAAADPTRETQFAAAQDVPAPKPKAEPKIGDVPPLPSPAPPAVRGTAPSTGGALSLAEVLDAVERHYPLLRAVEAERVVAGGRLLSSYGAFDLNLTGSVENQTGTYESTRTSLGLSQGLPFAGLGLFAGYRTGSGEFPTYNLGQKTAESGEFRAGVTVPLLRDRAIDRPRATVAQAGLDVQIAEPTIDRQRLDFQRAAARTYWAWVGAGQRLRVAEELVKLADERDGQLRARVQVGPLANIERVDNQQFLAQRNGLLVQAQRAFQQAGIELSLFLRDATGRPTLAGLDRLPSFPPVGPVDPAGFDAALAAALEARPEPRRLRLQRERALVDLRLAENQTLPAVNAVVAGTQDVGPGKSSLSGPNGLDRASLNAGVLVQFPIQFREARGRVMTAQAQVAQLELQLRQAEDVVRAEVQDTFSALERAAEFHKQAAQRVELARVVAAASRERLRLGTANVLEVTQREAAAFDAEVTEIGARQDYFRALAEFRAAVGR